MTLNELKQLYYINREIPLLQERIEEMQSQIERMTTVITGMPRSGGNSIDLKDELVDLKNLLKLKQKQCMLEKNRIERYIDSIDDSMTRTIFALRFINCLPWNQIAYSIGGYNTEDSVRKTCYRYIDKHK